jgi:hypothetical protein
MRLRPDTKNSSTTTISYSGGGDGTSYHGGHVDLLLPPLSLYVLTGNSRYRYTHELLPSQSLFRGIEVTRGHRVSVIFRDARTDLENAVVAKVRLWALVNPRVWEKKSSEVAGD